MTLVVDCGMCDLSADLRLGTTFFGFENDSLIPSQLTRNTARYAVPGKQYNLSQTE
jgi:hypothetical protein